MGFENNNKPSHEISEQPLHRDAIISQLRERREEPEELTVEMPESVHNTQPRFVQKIISERIQSDREKYNNGEPFAKMDEMKSAQDITSELYEENFTDKIKKLTDGDYLREYLSEKVEQGLIDDAVKSFEHIGHITLDLNGLKAVNDISGHRKGDTYLQRVAAWLWNSDTLQHIVREGGTILRSRTAGDEFAITITGDPNKSEWNEDRWRNIRMNLQFELEGIDMSDLVDAEDIKKTLPNAPEDLQFKATAGIGFSTLENALSNKPKNGKDAIGETDQTPVIVKKLMGAMLDASDKDMFAHKKFYKRIRNEEGNEHEQALMELLTRTEEQRTAEEKFAL